HAGDSRPRPARRAARHDPALPDLLGDPRRRAAQPPPRDRGRAAAGRGPDIVSSVKPADAAREPQLAGQTVVVIGGSAGIGLETARRAREEGADLIITARDPDRVHRAGLELGPSIGAF